MFNESYMRFSQMRANNSHVLDRIGMLINAWYELESNIKKRGGPSRTRNDATRKAYTELEVMFQKVIKLEAENIAFHSDYPIILPEVRNNNNQNKK